MLPPSYVEDAFLSEPARGSPAFCGQVAKREQEGRAQAELQSRALSPFCHFVRCGLRVTRPRLKVRPSVQAEDVDLLSRPCKARFLGEKQKTCLPCELQTWKMLEVDAQQCQQCEVAGAVRRIV